jgi:hypothetical protein
LFEESSLFINLEIKRGGEGGEPYRLIMQSACHWKKRNFI